MLLARTSGLVNQPSSGDQVHFDFIRYSPTPISAGEVADIVTPDISIPRIEPTR